MKDKTVRELENQKKKVKSIIFWIKISSEIFQLSMAATEK